MIIPRRLVFVLGAFSLTACVDEAEILILEPARAAMLAKGQQVTVKIQGTADQVTVNGATTITGADVFSTSLPPADGLGFVYATQPGDDFIAVRSWHQGDYNPAHGWHADTLPIRAGKGVLSTDQVSVAGIIGELIAKEELAGFVNNPIKMTLTIVVPAPVNVIVTSAIAATATITITISNHKVSFEALLTDLLVKYKATATVVNSTGTALYKTMKITGDVALDTSQTTVSNLKVDAGSPQITDGGGLPAAVIQVFANLLDPEIKKAISEATGAAIKGIITQFMAEIRPTVGLTFPKPIKQESTLNKISVQPTTLDLAYKTKIEATTPATAAASHKVLTRVIPAHTDTVPGLSAYVGSGLVNQYAFAMWDAGNLAGITFTKSELEAVGMGALDWPYSNLEQVTLSVLLPPLLEWRADGPYLDVGGVEARISITHVEDSTAWTAASVPVKLERKGDELRLKPDPTRKTSIRKVGFDKMSDLADQDKVMTLLHTAVPGVVDKVFGSLPSVVMPQVTFSKLDKTKGPTVTPTISDLKRLSNSWRLDLALKKK